VGAVGAYEHGSTWLSVLTLKHEQKMQAEKWSEKESISAHDSVNGASRDRVGTMQSGDSWRLGQLLPR